jgi:hypothetical protein
VAADDPNRLGAAPASDQRPIPVIGEVVRHPGPGPGANAK